MDVQRARHAGALHGGSIDRSYTDPENTPSPYDRGCLVGIGSEEHVASKMFGAGLSEKGAVTQGLEQVVIDQVWRYTTYAAEIL